MTSNPLITLAVPSFNQGAFLEQALRSIFEQNLPIEVFLADAGSTDNTLSVIEEWSDRLSGWRSHPDKGQAAAINECIAYGTAPYVAWLNSDDCLLPNKLMTLVQALTEQPTAPAAYGRAWHYHQETSTPRPVWVEPFSERRLATRCIICQPATLIRRIAWEALGGLNTDLSFAMDYDLWWRLYRNFGPLAFVDDDIAINREHEHTKTRRNRKAHYAEAMSIVKQYYGRVPIKWWLAQPYAVWFRSLFG